MKINQYGVLFQPSLIRNLKHSMSFNCHYTFGIGALIGSPKRRSIVSRRVLLPGFLIPVVSLSYLLVLHHMLI